MDKPFLTFEQQVEKLKKDYGLIINDYNFAIQALSSFSYYDIINGYQSIYMLDNKYKKGTTIELLCVTHMFNKNIQGVLFKYSTYVENTFKTLLSHVIAKSFTEHQDKYLDINNYKFDHDPKRRKKLKTIISDMERTCRESYDNPTKHYRVNKNHVPPWILFRNRSFSDTTDLFYFLKNEEKQYLLSHLDFFKSNGLDYSINVKIVLDSLIFVRKFRNKIAHNLDFLTYRGASLNKNANLFFNDTLILQNEMNITRNDIWGMIISIVMLLNNKYLVQNFLAEFNSFMRFDDEICKLYCAVTGVPFDFEQRIINFREKSFDI